MSTNKEELFDEDHAMDLILNNMINELRKVRVRFANESEYIIIEKFDLSKFEIQKEFDYDFYGLYEGNPAMVNKEDFKNCV